MYIFAVALPQIVISPPTVNPNILAGMGRTRTTDLQFNISPLISYCTSKVGPTKVFILVVHFHNSTSEIRYHGPHVQTTPHMWLYKLLSFNSYCLYLFLSRVSLPFLLVSPQLLSTFTPLLYLSLSALFCISPSPLCYALSLYLSLPVTLSCLQSGYSFNYFCSLSHEITLLTPLLPCCFNTQLNSLYQNSILNR